MPFVFANDLFSLSKEIAQSASPEFNLVTILKRTHSISLEDAIQVAALIHDEAVKEFIELEKTVYVFSPDINLQLRKYIEGLQHIMIGNIVWSTKDTSRYPHLAMERGVSAMGGRRLSYYADANNGKMAQSFSISLWSIATFFLLA